MFFHLAKDTCIYVYDCCRETMFRSTMDGDKIVLESNRHEKTENGYDEFWDFDSSMDSGVFFRAIVGGSLVRYTRFMCSETPTRLRSFLGADITAYEPIYQDPNHPSDCSDKLQLDFHDGQPMLNILISQCSGMVYHQGSWTPRYAEYVE